MTSWVQEVGQRFLSTRLSADKFLCTIGRQSHRYVKKHFDQFNVYRLLYFPTQISSLVGTSAQIDWALQWTKSSSAWRWCKFLVLHLSAYLSFYETALFLNSSHCTALWTNLHLGSRHLHWAARWSFLQSLQIPVNSQALSLGNAQWLSHFLEHPPPQIMRTSPQSRIMHLLRTT